MGYYTEGDLWKHALCRALWHGHSPSITAAICAVPVQDRMSALLELATDDSSSLNFAVQNSTRESIETLFFALPTQDRLKVFQPLLYNAVRYSTPEAIQVLLTFLPEEDRLTALQQRDKDGRSLLDNAVLNTKAIQVLLTSLPEGDRLKACQEGDIKERLTLLHRAAKQYFWRESYAEPSTDLPESERMAERLGAMASILEALTDEQIQTLAEERSIAYNADRQKMAQSFIDYYKDLPDSDFAR